MDGLLIVSFGLLQVADGAITYVGLRCTHIDEANPLASFCFETFGLGASITLLKLLGIAFIAFVFVRRRRIRSPWVTATLCAVVAGYCWVVAQNLALVLSV
ncbi:MAG: hypothetical protein FJ189_02925 [Gammaproteobacteria bacterium]|nr:hypothetical protein [Gammaproteobacteria bacterium]